MQKTGRQIFKGNIFDKIDNHVMIEEIISTGDSYEFRVCEPKWMRIGSTFTDTNSYTWNVTSIDYDTKTVIATRPDVLATLKRFDVILIEMPVFKSGTPISVNKEHAMILNSGLTDGNILIWLLETIQGEDGLQTETTGGKVDFVFYILFKIDTINTLNEDRHNLGIIQATQLRYELKRIMDNTNGVSRDSRIAWKEFNLFGRETTEGIERYILDSNLSGIECRVTVNFSTKLICKC